MIVYKRVSSVEPVAAFIAGRLKQLLATNQRVTWFVSGGSCVEIAAKVGLLLTSVPVGQLTITLVDERYGVPGHTVSNWQQLQQAGLAIPGVQLIPVLTGELCAQTAEQFAQVVRQAFDSSYCFGLFGIGADGHTAGILPGSLAVNSMKLVVSYIAADFERITLTPQAIAQFDEAVVYASGLAKRRQLQNLTDDLQLSE